MTHCRQAKLEKALAAPSAPPGHVAAAVRAVLPPVRAVEHPLEDIVAWTPVGFGQKIEVLWGKEMKTNTILGFVWEKWLSSFEELWWIWDGLASFPKLNLMPDVMQVPKIFGHFGRHLRLTMGRW